MLSSMPGCSQGVQPSDAQQVSLHCNHISKDCNITDANKKTQEVHSGAIFADVGRNPTPHTLYETLGKKKCSDLLGICDRPTEGSSNQPTDGQEFMRKLHNILRCSFVCT